MNARRRTSRGWLAALTAAGLGLPVAVVIGAVVLGADSPSGDCSTRSLSAGADEVGLVAAGPDPLAWRVYEDPVDEEPLRHNHLHGGIVVQYGDRVAAPVVRRVADWYDADSTGILVAPLPELGSAIRATAWASSLTCRTFEHASFAEFRDAHRYRAPERVPREQLTLGSGGAPVVGPQPVRKRATISFALPDARQVEVRIRDEAGRPVRRLGSFVGSAGQRLRLHWDVRDDRGRRVPPGRYDVVVQPARLPSFSVRFRVG